MDDDAQEFPSVTVPMKFDGTLGIGTDFSVVLKFKVDAEHGLPALEDLKKLDRGVLDATFVSRQAALKGDSTDREWSSMDMPGTEEIQYEAFCIGSRCPVFTVHTSGDLEGKYVCEDAADVSAYMEVKQGSTRCPRFPQETLDVEDPDGPERTAAEEEQLEQNGIIDGDFTEEEPEPGAEGSTLADPGPETTAPEPDPQEEKTAEATDDPPPEDPSVQVVYPDEGGVWTTPVGPTTQYAEFVHDFIAWYAPNHTDVLDPKDFIVTDDEGNERKLKSKVKKADHGATLYVESLAVDA